MSAVNTCVLVGRVYSDKIDMDTSGERPRAKFTMTVRRGQGRADFVPVTAWGSQAEFADKYLEKGKGVAVRGEFRSNRVEGSEGVRWFYGVDAYDINFLPDDELEEKPREKRSGGTRSGNSSRYRSTEAYDEDPF